jgi:hypothetical protein
MVVARLVARCAASVALLVPLLLVAAAPVIASCAMPVPIEQAIREADSVFVGTVTGLSNSDRWAIVAVQEVWAGPELGPVVEVRGGPEGNTATSVDRSYTRGTRYLFLTYVSDGSLSDNACSSTTEWQPALTNLRPSNARPPMSAVEPETGAPFDPASLLLPGALIVGAGVFVFGGILVLRRRA